MNIIVLATAARIGGAKTIYNQFIQHLPQYIGDNRYYLFVDPTVAQPEIEGVTYIHDANHSWRHRIYWDFWGFKNWVKKSGVTPDVVVSLQNTTVICHCKSVVYYHQPLPFYSDRWNLFKKEERALFLYKHIYPLFVKATVGKKAKIVVQIPFIKKGFVRTFNHPEDKVHVLFPDTNVDIPEENEEDDILKDRKFFIYPANSKSYKQHRTIINAVHIAKTKYPELTSSLKVVFTLVKAQNADLYRYVEEKGCVENIDFIGHVEYKQLMRLVKNSRGLLFPSTIETLGLPLVEAAVMGKPIIAADKDYSREVLLDYPGVTFLPYNDYEKWCDAIISLHNDYKIFSCMQQRESTWEKFFYLIYT